MGAGEGGEVAGAEAGVAAAAVTGPGTPRTDLVTEVRVIMLPNMGLLGTRGLRKMLTIMGDLIKMLFNIMGLSKDLASIREPSTSPGSITKEPSRVTSTTTTITTRVKGGQIQGTTISSSSSRAEAGVKCSSTAGTDTIMDTMATVTVTRTMNTLASITRTMHMMVTITRTRTRTTAARLTAAEDEVTTAVAGPAARDRGGPGDRRTSRTWPPRRPT